LLWCGGNVDLVDVRSEAHAGSALLEVVLC
jgi:hypothetical protein